LIDTHASLFRIRLIHSIHNLIHMKFEAKIEAIFVVENAVRLTRVGGVCESIRDMREMKLEWEQINVSERKRERAFH